MAKWFKINCPECGHEMHDHIDSFHYYASHGKEKMTCSKCEFPLLKLVDEPDTKKASWQV